MTPGARIAASIDIVGMIEGGPRPADDAAADYFRRRRFIGAKDRAAISAQVYAVLRHRAALDWWIARSGAGAGIDPSRSRVLAALLLVEQRAPDAVIESFDGGRFRPAALKPGEASLVRSLAGRSLRHPEMPRAVAVDLPAWLEAPLGAVYGESLEREMAALNAPAPMDLRVNALKGGRDEARRALAAERIYAKPTRWSPLGLRIEGRMPIGASAAFKAGLVEVQDEGSQLAALLAEARPGMRVVDFCAGAGGKTLALAAAMGNRGKLVACDIAGWRLERAAQRLRRAGIGNAERRVLADERDPWVKHHAKSFDRVFVDAPCLGIGTWRRNPDAKWRARPGDLAELVVRQQAILQSAARLVRPGGRLVYATCSLLREEDEAQAEAFLAASPDFALYPITRAWAETIGGDCPGESDYLRLTPAQHGTDGFFVALFERRAEPSRLRGASFETPPPAAPQDEDEFRWD